MYHELPTANGGFSNLLPSDLCQISAYQDIERAQRQRMEQAGKTLETINPILSKLHELLKEVNGL